MNYETWLGLIWLFYRGTDEDWQQVQDVAKEAVGAELLTKAVGPDKMALLDVLLELPHLRLAADIPRGNDWDHQY